MIPIRCHTVSGVALSTVQGETRLLMMKRVKGGFWCHVAGTVEAGETGWQTIVREFREETGIVVHELYNGQYLEQFYEDATNTVCLVPVFVVYCPPTQAVTLNHEHTEYRWCPWPRPRRWQASPASRHSMITSGTTCRKQPLGADAGGHDTIAGACQKPCRYPLDPVMIYIRPWRPSAHVAAPDQVVFSKDDHLE